MSNSFSLRKLWHSKPLLLLTWPWLWSHLKACILCFASPAVFRPRPIPIRGRPLLKARLRNCLWSLPCRILQPAPSLSPPCQTLRTLSDLQGLAKVRRSKTVSSATLGLRDRRGPGYCGSVSLAQSRTYGESIDLQHMIKNWCYILSRNHNLYYKCTAVYQNPALLRFFLCSIRVCVLTTPSSLWPLMLLSSSFESLPPIWVERCGGRLLSLGTTLPLTTA